MLVLVVWVGNLYTGRWCVEISSRGRLTLGGLLPTLPCRPLSIQQAGAAQGGFCHHPGSVGVVGRDKLRWT